MSEEECCLKDLMKCNHNGGGNFSNVSVEQLRRASIQRQDGLHDILSTDPSKTYRCHKNCIATYTSKHHIKRSVKSEDKEEAEFSSQPVAKRHCSSTDTFIYLLFFVVKYVCHLIQDILITVEE